MCFDVEANASLLQNFQIYYICKHNQVTVEKRGYIAVFSLLDKKMRYENSEAEIKKKGGSGR